MSDEETFNSLMQNSNGNLNQLVKGNELKSQANNNINSLLPPLRDSSWELDDTTAPDKYKINGLNESVYKELRRSAIEATLDLHGKTVVEAHTALNNFLCNVSDQHFTGVEIIHGRGAHSGKDGGVLKNTVRNWLMKTAIVKAYCEPLKNNGAVLVRLRNNRRF